MKELLINLEDKYKNYIAESPLPDNQKADFIDLLNSDNCLYRQKIWDSFRINYSNIEFSKFANPYYIGFGNPYSEILFVGKEKGFDLKNNPELVNGSVS